MLEIKQGEVIEILDKREGLTEVKLKIKGKEKKGIGYDDLIGPLKVGDQVVVNTTATSLKLGTGGYDFIIYVLNSERELANKGHIMKLRYTPYQLQTYSVAEQDSPYHEQISHVTSLAEIPVVVATLHSMLPAIAVMIKATEPKAKITYIMTDGAALPIQFSRLVYFLKKEGLIDDTITIGHSFGGDLEAVNIYSGLIAANKVNQADVIIVSMGPGIVGTGTKYGFSGTEQADILHAVNILGGKAIAVPRMSFSDARERHYGLSHHSRTNLGQLTLVRTKIGLPFLEKEKEEVIKSQLIESNIIDKHNICYRKGRVVLDQLDNLNCEIKTMGRGHQQEKEYFMTAGIAGLIAGEELKKG